jgi:hypothetical protein
VIFADIDILGRPGSPLKIKGGFRDVFVSRFARVRGNF